MANVVIDLEQKKLICPPKWLPANVHYLTIMGSVAYGVSADASDMDVYGFCIPPKEVVFPPIEIGGRAVDPFFNINRPEELAEAEALLSVTAPASRQP